MTRRKTALITAAGIILLALLLTTILDDQAMVQTVWGVATFLLAFVLLASRGVRRPDR